MLDVLLAAADRLLLNPNDRFKMYQALASEILHTPDEAGVPRLVPFRPQSQCLGTRPFNLEQECETLNQHCSQVPSS